MPARTAVNQLIANQPMVCTFCGCPADVRYSSYNVIAMDRKALICSACIRRAAHRVNLGVLQSAPKWTKTVSDRIGLRMRRALAGERAPQSAKNASIDMGLALSRRSHRLLKAREMGLPLPVPLSFSIRDGDIGLFRALLDRAMGQVGISVYPIDAEDLMNDDAENLVSSACRCGHLIWEHTVLFVRDFIPFDLHKIRFSAVCACDLNSAVSLDEYEQGQF